MIDVTTTQTPETARLTVLDPNNTEHWMEVHAAGCPDLNKINRRYGMPRGRGAWQVQAATLLEAAEYIAGDFIDSGEMTPDEAVGHIHWSPCVKLPVSFVAGTVNQPKGTKAMSAKSTEAKSTEAPATVPATPPTTDKTQPGTQQWYLNGKPVGPTMNRLNRVAPFYSRNIATIPEYAQYGHGKPWINTENWLKLVAALGVTDVNADFDVTLPNGNLISVRYGQGGSPVPQPKVAKATAKATKAAEKAASTDNLKAMKAEAELVKAWKAAGSVEADKPATPLLDAREAKAKADKEAKAARLEAAKKAVTEKKAPAKAQAEKAPAEVTPITKASQTRRPSSKRTATKAAAAKVASVKAKVETVTAERDAAEAKITELRSSTN